MQIGHTTPPSPKPAQMRETLSSIARDIRARGHEAWTPTLTGLGERAHLAGGAINLDTHIDDIANVLLYEQLTQVILCGHSYAGMVITGVADHTSATMAVPPRRERYKLGVVERGLMTLGCFFSIGKQNSFAMRLTDAIWRPSALAISGAVDF